MQEKYDQNFVLKVYIVITSKVFADFRFESSISIDFQNEILALLPPKSAKTFHESLQILSPLRLTIQSKLGISRILFEIKILIINSIHQERRHQSDKNRTECLHACGKYTFWTLPSFEDFSKITSFLIANKISPSKFNRFHYHAHVEYDFQTFVRVDQEFTI